MIGVTSRKPQTREPEPFAREEEYDLILRYNAGDERAIRQLICKYRNLIYKAVSRYGSQVDSRILVSAGETAVHIAARGFDLSKGNRFSTYLVPTIRTEVRDCFCNEIGITRNTLENLGKISKASTTFRQALGREATLEEIADLSKLSQKQILNALKRKEFAQPYSLNQRFTEAGFEWLDSQSDKTVDPWNKSEESELLDTFDQLEDEGYLQSRQVTILIAKHQGYKSSEIGEQLGVSGERVRQLIKDAKRTFVAFEEGVLKLKPQPAKTTTPVSTHHNIEPIGEGDPLPLNLPEPEQVRELALKRVDASRLGGRIGRAVKKLFTQTKERFDAERIPRSAYHQEAGGIANAAKHLLVPRRCSDHRTADRSGHQSTPENQRCSGLGQIKNAWRGCLGFSQVILSFILLPLVLVYQTIRGFQNSDRPSKRRSMMSFVTTCVSKVFGCGYRKEHPRPPN